ncbi:MAG: site-specific DNA-methyltransferase [Desulfuromonadales bacterium]|nr:site-specific DNA-methyltransferase [Desulfuromonadales bacterium]
MARIEDEIGKIADPVLRATLFDEVKKLKTEKRFGLVFEEHLPELVPIYGARVKARSLVARRGRTFTETFKVVRVHEGMAEVEKNDGSRENIPVDELTVVRRFGEPIYPALRPFDRVRNGDTSQPHHILIEADNYHALQLLEYCYSGKVDCIYIDPPYNTGAKDWKYNNDYVDGNDTWRHSKWLSFMEKRLLLAERLLSPDGVLIVTIDEHEVHNLGVLLKQILKNTRDIQMVTIVTNTAGSMSPGKFSRAEEYAFFCFYGNSKPIPMNTDMLSDAKPFTQFWFPLFRSRGLNDRPSKRPNLVYPIAVDPDTLKIIAVGKTLKERVDVGEITGNLDNWKPDLSEQIDGYPVVWPVLDSYEVSTWQVSTQTLTKLVSEGFVRISKSKNDNGPRSFTISYVKDKNRKLILEGKIRISGKETNGAYILEGGTRTTIPKSTWKVATHDARLYGTTMLRSVLGKSSFTYPKSPYATLDSLMTVVSDKKSALIVDFFAGSGTTLQAVSLLNERDGGNRNCILITNNEVSDDDSKDLFNSGYKLEDPQWDHRGICRSITWPRSKYTILGKRDDGTELEGEYLYSNTNLKDGFPANLEYFKLDFLDPAEVQMGRQFAAILPVLWMMAGARGPLPDAPDSHAPWLIPADCPFAVLIQEKRFKEFHRHVEARDDLTHVFIVTNSSSTYHNLREELEVPHVVQLYRDYLQNFKINYGKD